MSAPGPPKKPNFQFKLGDLVLCKCAPRFNASRLYLECIQRQRQIDQSRVSHGSGAVSSTSPISSESSSSSSRSSTNSSLSDSTDSSDSRSSNGSGSASGNSLDSSTENKLHAPSLPGLSGNARGAGYETEFIGRVASPPLVGGLFFYVFNCITNKFVVVPMDDFIEVLPDPTGLNDTATQEEKELFWLDLAQTRMSLHQQKQQETQSQGLIPDLDLSARSEFSQQPNVKRVRRTGAEQADGLPEDEKYAAKDGLSASGSSDTLQSTQKQEEKHSARARRPGGNRQSNDDDITSSSGSRKMTASSRRDMPAVTLQGRLKAGLTETVVWQPNKPGDIIWNPFMDRQSSFQYRVKDVGRHLLSSSKYSPLPLSPFGQSWKNDDMGNFIWYFWTVTPLTLLEEVAEDSRIPLQQMLAIIADLLHQALSSYLSSSSAAIQSTLSESILGQTVLVPALRKLVFRPGNHPNDPLAKIKNMLRCYNAWMKSTFHVSEYINVGRTYISLKTSTPLTKTPLLDPKTKEVSFPMYTVADGDSGILYYLEPVLEQDGASSELAGTSDEQQTREQEQGQMSRDASQWGNPATDVLVRVIENAGLFNPDNAPKAVITDSEFGSIQSAAALGERGLGLISEINETQSTLYPMEQLQHVDVQEGESISMVTKLPLNGALSAFEAPLQILAQLVQTDESYTFISTAASNALEMYNDFGQTAATHSRDRQSIAIDATKILSDINQQLFVSIIFISLVNAYDFYKYVSKQQNQAALSAPLFYLRLYEDMRKYVLGISDPRFARFVTHRFYCQHVTAQIACKIFGLDALPKRSEKQNGAPDNLVDMPTSAGESHGEDGAALSPAKRSRKKKGTSEDSSSGTTGDSADRATTAAQGQEDSGSRRVRFLGRCRGCGEQTAYCCLTCSSPDRFSFFCTVRGCFLPHRMEVEKDFFFRESDLE